MGKTNKIKTPTGSYSLQVTHPARSAGLVEENADGDSTYLAKVRVHAFDDLLLVVDRDRVDAADEAELVASAARDTGTKYQSINARVSPAGHGYQVYLPTAEDAGFREGDKAPVVAAPGVLFIAPQADSEETPRLVAALESIRRSQVDEAVQSR